MPEVGGGGPLNEETVGFLHYINIDARDLALAVPPLRGHRCARITAMLFLRWKVTAAIYRILNRNTHTTTYDTTRIELYIGNITLLIQVLYR